MYNKNIPLRKKNRLQNSTGSKILFTIIFVVFAVGIGMAIRPWIQEKPAIASNNEISEIENSEVSVSQPINQNEDINSFEQIASSESEQPINSDPSTELTRLSNGVEMTISNFRREGEYIKIDICFDMIDSSDWMLDFKPTVLIFGNEQTFRKGAKNISWQQASEGQMGYRCDTAKFDVPSYADDGDFTLVISQLTAPPREGEGCDFYLNQVQPKLDAQGTGITFSCTNEGWGAIITIENKPSDMSIEEAEQMVLDPQFYAYPGHWEFTFRLGD